MITNPLRARDTRLMAGALRALGARINDGENRDGTDGGSNTGGGGGSSGVGNGLSAEKPDIVDVRL